MALQQNITTKMRGVVEEYSLLKKNKSRQSVAQKHRQEGFTNSLSQLFDIAHKNAKNMLKIEEDRVFLADQRGPRIITMGGIDKNLTEQEERSRRRKEKEEDGRKRE